MPRPCRYNLEVNQMKKTKCTLESGVSKFIDGEYDSVAAIRRGLDQAEAGMGRPVDDVFDDLERALSERKSKRKAESARRS